MFKEILQFSLALALVAAENSPSEGFCMNSNEVFLWCTAGTPLGARLLDAFISCSDTEGEGKGKGDRAGGDTMCPSVEQVEAWFMEDYQGKRERVSDLWL